MIAGMRFIGLILLLQSCAFFSQKELSPELGVSLDSVCLSSRGKGRLQVGESKYVFSYEAALDQERANWILALNFPLRPQETLTLDWSENGQTKLKTSLDDKILKENQGVNPESVEIFVQGLGRLIQEIIETRTNDKPLKNKKYKWKKIRNELWTINEDKNLKAKFKKLGAEGFFTLMELSYLEPEKSYYKLDLVVRRCFENNLK